MVNASGSITVSRWRFEPKCAFEEIAEGALKAKPTHAATRTQLRWPSFRGRYSKNRSSSYARSLRTYFVRWGFRIMNDAQRFGAELPTEVELESLFYERGHARAVIHSDYDHEGGGRRIGISVEGLEIIAASAARAVVDEWRSNYTQVQRRRGAAGGRASRRGPSVTVEDVLMAEASSSRRLSHAEVATLLGCSTATVERRRRDLRHLT